MFNRLFKRKKRLVNHLWLPSTLAYLFASTKRGLVLGGTYIIYGDVNSFKTTLLLRLIQGAVSKPLNVMVRLLYWLKLKEKDTIVYISTEEPEQTIFAKMKILGVSPKAVARSSYHLKITIADSATVLESLENALGNKRVKLVLIDIVFLTDTLRIKLEDIARKNKIALVVTSRHPVESKAILRASTALHLARSRDFVIVSKVNPYTKSARSGSVVFDNRLYANAFLNHCSNWTENHHRKFKFHPL